MQKKSENGKYGFVDRNGQWIVPPKYDLASWHENDHYGTFSENTYLKEGAVNKYGKIIFPCIYEGIYMSFDKELNRYEVRLEKSKEVREYGVYDAKSGKVIIPAIYDYIGKDGNIYKCKLHGKKGYFDINGKVIIPVKYESVLPKGKDGKEGFRVETEDGKKGFYDKNGHVIIPESEYSYLVKDNDYFIVQKGEYRGFLDANGQEVLSLNLGYSKRSAVASDGIFLVEKNGKFGYYANGKEIIPCQYDEASVFTNDVATVKKDGQVKLIKNPLKDGSKIQIAENTVAVSKKKVGGPAVSRYPAPNSDVDKNIPSGNQKNENTFAFIIANENYPDAPVPYSLNDGRMFKEYCNKTLSIPEKNINLYEDATFGNIITAVEKVKSIADAYDGEASVIFYYAGHGFPDEKQNTAYLLPVDGNASDITTTGYSLAKLYKDIAALKLKSSIIFLDACFSGAKREDNMLASSRGVAIKVKEEAPQGNMVVFSAAQGDETAHQIEEKGHGLFTYYLLKELQQTGGNVTLGELSKFVTKQVKRQSVVINNKKQTPTIIPSQSVASSWQNMKLK